MSRGNFFDERKKDMPEKAKEQGKEQEKDVQGEAVEQQPEEYQQLSFDSMVDSSKPADKLDEIPGVEAYAPPEDAETGVNAFSLTTYSDAPAMDQSDVFIPRLRLAQGLTPEVQSGDAKPGQWIVTGYEPLDRVTIVPLLFSRQRRLTDDEFNTLCRSDDAITGVGNPGGLCEKCPMNQWTDGPKGRREPPKCTFAYSYVVFVNELQTLAVIEFKRTSIQAGKTLNTMVAQRGLGNFAASLMSSAKQGPRGSYYSATINPTLTPENALALARQSIGH